MSSARMEEANEVDNSGSTVGVSNGGIEAMAMSRCDRLLVVGPSPGASTPMYHDDDDCNNDELFSMSNSSLETSLWTSCVRPGYRQQLGGIRLQFDLTANGIKLHFGQSAPGEGDKSVETAKTPQVTGGSDDTPAASPSDGCLPSDQITTDSDEAMLLKSTSAVTDDLTGSKKTAGDDFHTEANHSTGERNTDNSGKGIPGGEDNPVKDTAGYEDISRCTSQDLANLRDSQPSNNNNHSTASKGRIQLKCSEFGVCAESGSIDMESSSSYLDGGELTESGRRCVSGFGSSLPCDAVTKQGECDSAIIAEEVDSLDVNSLAADDRSGDDDANLDRDNCIDVDNGSDGISEGDIPVADGLEEANHSTWLTVGDPRDLSKSRIDSVVQTVLGEDRLSDVDENITINIANISASPDGEELRWTNVVHIPRHQSPISEHATSVATATRPCGATCTDATSDGCQYYHLFYYYDMWHFQMLQEKNKLYRAKLNKGEACKRQQFKILRKTHELHLQDKQCLIENLKDIVEEQEARIRQLEVQSKGATQAASDGGHCCNTKTLIEQILKLQQEKSDLQLLLLNREDERKEDDITQLREANEKLEQEKQQLQEEIAQLWSKKDSDRTDTEKELCRKEIEIDQLQEELQNAQSNVNKLQGQLEVIRSQKEDTEADGEKLREENGRLQAELESALSDLRRLDQQKASTETKYEQQITELTTENEKLKEEIELIKVDLKQAQDKPAEVITKVERVEVESKQCHEELARCQMALTNTERELISHKEEALTWQNNYCDVKDELEKSNHMLSSLKHVEAERDRLVNEVEELKTKLQQNEDELVSEKNSVTDLEKQLNIYKTKLANLHMQMAEQVRIIEQKKDAQIEEIRRQHEVESRDQREKLATVQLNLLQTHNYMMELMKEYQRLKEICRKFPEWGRITIQELGNQVQQAIQHISEYNVQLVRKYRKEMTLRKKYHNELVELKGNIRVFCRVRPYIKEDGSGAQAESVVSYDPDDDAIVNVLHRGRTQTFELDRVFTPESTQQEVYSEVASLVVSCIDGYNVCIFAYGQTGSGKTYTMEGPPEHPGINQRALQELFRETAQRCEEWEFTITVSVVEIYNETIRDLLSDDRQEKLDIKMSPEGGVHLPGLLSYQVQSVDDVNQVFALGKRNRVTATTNMNEHSSRSHALLCVTVTGENLTTGARTVGRLNLVDLAGSERVSKSGAEGARLREAQNINKSLATLGDVIHALRNKQSHIPYRNSKLTYLLQDSLGGDSKTLMIVQVAPVEKNVAETVASLAFAQRVRAVELGQATRRVDGMENSPCEKKKTNGSSQRLPLRQTSNNSKVNRVNRR